MVYQFHIAPNGRIVVPVEIVHSNHERQEDWHECHHEPHDVLHQKTVDQTQSEQTRPQVECHTRNNAPAWPASEKLHERGQLIKHRQVRDTTFR
jgi:hypothetical protein